MLSRALAFLLAFFSMFSNFHFVLFVCSIRCSSSLCSAFFNSWDDVSLSLQQKNRITSTFSSHSSWASFLRQNNIFQHITALFFRFFFSEKKQIEENRITKYHCRIARRLAVPGVFLSFFYYFCLNTLNKKKCLLAMDGLCPLSP